MRKVAGTSVTTDNSEITVDVISEVLNNSILIQLTIWNYYTDEFLYRETEWKIIS